MSKKKVVNYGSSEPCPKSEMTYITDSSPKHYFTIDRSPEGDMVIKVDFKRLLEAHGAEFVKARVMNDVIYITGKKPAQ